MARIYYNRIKAGFITLEQIPLRWYNAVKALLNEDK